MREFKQYTGTTVPLMNDNVDTDQLMPKQFLKRIEKRGYGKYLLYAWRYLDEDFTENLDFVLNRPEYRKATILIAGENFGSGSSREHAAWGLVDYGFRVIIAGSFADIHYNNELNNGLLPIVQPLAVREQLAKLQPWEEITIDLPNQKLYTPFGEFSFHIDGKWKEKLVNGMDDISITMTYEDQIAEYERRRPIYWRE